VFWARVKVNANWGRCNKITTISHALGNEANAYVFATQSDGKELAHVTFETRDTFFCSHFEERRTVHSNSLVEAVQDASRKHNALTKEVK
jgi:hypothetical protein